MRHYQALLKVYMLDLLDNCFGTFSCAHQAHWRLHSQHICRRVPLCLQPRPTHQTSNPWTVPTKLNTSKMACGLCSPAWSTLSSFTQFSHMCSSCHISFLSVFPKSNLPLSLVDFTSQNFVSLTSLNFPGRPICLKEWNDASLQRCCPVSLTSPR